EFVATLERTPDREFVEEVAKLPQRYLKLIDGDRISVHRTVCGQFEPVFDAKRTEDVIATGNAQRIFQHILADRTDEFTFDIDFEQIDIVTHCGNGLIGWVAETNEKSIR